MKSGWRVISLSELCSINSGESNTQDAIAEGGYAFFDRSKTVKRSHRYLYDCEALIIPGEGTEFLPRHFVGKFDLHQRAYALHHFREDVDPRYLYYFLIYSRDYWPRVAVGATVKSLRQRHFDNLPVDLAPLAEQRRIVGFLEEIRRSTDDAIATCRANLASTSDILASMIKAFMAGAKPDWVQTSIGQQVTLQRGFDITKNKQAAGVVPVVSSSGIKSWHNKAMADAPGVVLGRKGSLGTTFFLEKDFWPHDTTLWVKDFHGNDPKFVFYFFKGLDVVHLDSGAANPALNRNVVHAIPVRWPPLAAQLEAVQRLESVAARASKLHDLYGRKLSALEKLDRSILKRVFEGEAISGRNQLEIAAE